MYRLVLIPWKHDHKNHKEIFDSAISDFQTFLPWVCFRGFGYFCYVFQKLHFFISKFRFLFVLKIFVVFGNPARRQFFLEIVTFWQFQWFSVSSVSMTVVSKKWQVFENFVNLSLRWKYLIRRSRLTLSCYSCVLKSDGTHFYKVSTNCPSVS